MYWKLIGASCLALLLAHAPAGAGVTFLDGSAEGEFAVQCVVASEGGPAAQEDVRILFNAVDADNAYVAELHKGKAELLKVRDGKARRMAGPAPLPKGGAAQATLSILRRQWQMALLWDGKTVCRAYDDELQGGQVGYDGAAVREPFVQSLSEIYGSDDFVRTSGEAAGWTAARGEWQNCAVEEEGLKAEWNANPFAFLAKSPQNALAAYGNWFWDDYRAAVSAKGPAGGAVGICARYQDPDNFVLFRWAAALEGVVGGAGEKQLIQVSDGVWRILATSPGGYLPGQWCRLEVAVFGDRIEAYADRQLVMAYEPVAFGAGAAALYASDGGDAYFDDFRVEGIRALSDGFARAATDLPAVGPKWRSSGAKLTLRPNGVWLGAPRGVGVAVGGPDAWGDFSLRARVRAEDAGGMGVVFARWGPGEGYLLRWGGTGRTQYRGKLQLIRYADGEPTILAQAPGAHGVKQWQPFELTVRRGHVTARVGRDTRLECFDPTMPDGAVALFADRTKGVCFSQMDIRSVADETPEPRITEQFTKEATMSGWASPSGAWRMTEPGRLWWNRGAFYVDPAVEFKLPAVGSATGRITGIICGDGKSPDRGYGLRVTMRSGAPKLGLELLRRREVLAQADVESESGATPRVSLARRGTYLIASVDGKCAAFHRDEFPPPGHAAGLLYDGIQPDLATAKATTPNMVDYTFSDAPVDWYAARGDWRVMNRWPCKKGWAWYGGVGDKAPALWSKQSFAGDMTLEFYGAIRMDMPHEPGYSHASDLNCVIAGDGRRLDAGYAFIYAGWGNSKGGILRMGKLVAQNTAARFDNPVSMNFAFHRHWFYVRVEKEGNRIRYSVDDRPIASYEDPNPIPSGRVAFWTWDNGILIARARISYEAAVAPELPAARVPPDTTDLPYKLYANM